MIEYYSAIKKNAFESVLMRWMKLEPIIEWNKSERKTPIQYTNAYIWNLERWYQLPYMRDSKRDIDVKNSLSDCVGEGKGGMIWESTVETCILSYVKWITSPGLMHETGWSGLVHWKDPEGWDREGGGMGGLDGGSGWGTYVRPWLIHVDVWQKPSQYYKVISLQLK